jgi:hypothetical protein
MVDSEGARRLIALCAVFAGLGAQSVITSPVDANQSGVVQTYGVRLLGNGLAAPVLPTEQRPLAIPPPVAELDSSATTLFEAARLPDPATSVRLPTRRWLSTPSEFKRLDIPAYWPENRDSSGALGDTRGVETLNHSNNLQTNPRDFQPRRAFDRPRSRFASLQD